MQQNRTSRHADAGFTLIEVMVVVVIISLATAISLPIYDNAIEKSRKSAFAADSRKLYNAMMAYYADYSAFPSDKTFDTATLEPLSNEGYFEGAANFVRKLANDEVMLYFAPDKGGTDQQFIVILRHKADPTIIAAVVHTGVIASAGGWVDGVYIISDNELKQADDL